MPSSLIVRGGALAALLFLAVAIGLQIIGGDSPAARDDQPKQITAPGWPPARADEFLLAGHFGVRHYVSRNLSCSSPMIRTVSLAPIQGEYIIDAYHFAEKELRKFCGNYSSRFELPSPYSIQVEHFIGSDLYATFALSTGGEVRRAGKLGQVKKFNVAGERQSLDPVAETYWKNPRVFLNADSDLLSLATEALKGDIHFLLGIGATKRTRGLATNVNFGTFELDIDRKGNISEGSRTYPKIRNREHFDQAVKFGVPMALWMHISDVHEGQSNTKVWFEMPDSTLNEKQLPVFQALMRDLHKNRLHRFFLGLKVAKAQGINLDAILKPTSKQPAIVDQPPTKEHAIKALAQSIKETDCASFAYLYAKQKSRTQNLAYLSKALWNSEGSGCVMAGSQAGAKVAVRPDKVTALRCSGKEKSYRCVLSIKAECHAELPGSAGWMFSRGNQQSALYAKGICTTLEAMLGASSSTWNFVRSGLSWKALPARN